MKVYVVSEITGEYSQMGFSVKAAFSTRALADDYVAKMAALPGIPREYGAGSENEYSVDEMDVWDEPTERLMIFNKCEYIKPTGYDGDDHIWRNEEYAPAGYSGFWKAERNWEPETGWSDIRVAAPTAEECRAQFAAILSA